MVSAPDHRKHPFRRWAVAAGGGGFVVGTLLMVWVAGTGGPGTAATKAPAALPPDAWPMFRGPDGLGVAHHESAPRTWNGRPDKPAENIRWKVPIPKRGTSSPKGRHLVMASDGGVVTCLEAETGKRLWRKEFDEGFLSSPVIVGDRVYLMDQKGVTLVFRLGDTYEELHRNELGEKSNCTPAFPEGRIYIRTDRHLYCIGRSGP